MYIQRVGIEAISCLLTNLPSATTVFLTNANVLIKCCILLCCTELKLNTLIRCTVSCVVHVQVILFATCM